MLANRLDPATEDLAASCPKLADDLVFAPQPHAGKIYYHIESPSQGKFYRVGYPEYVFLSALDGTVSVAQALTLAARQLGAEALTRRQGEEVTQWLLEHDLVYRTDAGAKYESTRHGSRQTRTSGWNPFGLKWSWGSPEWLLDRMTPVLGWLFSPAATLAGIVLIVVGFVSLGPHGEAFAASARGILHAQNWLWLALIACGLKIIHELGHAVACRYYLGDVREVGLIFVLLAPLAYVDVTSSWRFPSKWQRIHVALAGIYVELLIAGAAALAWPATESAFVQQLLHYVVMLATVTTLVFNLNPLMRFDGYYVLADLLEIPNLSTEGRRYLKDVTRKVLYGESPRSCQTWGFRRVCIATYGLASGAWRLLICFSLCVSAAVLFHGAGIVLAVLGVVTWLGRPLCAWFLDLARVFQETPFLFGRAVAVIALTVAAIAGGLYLPFPGRLSAPAVVEYADLTVVRNRAAGFVTQILVHDGQAVVRGQVLVTLRNEDLEAELTELEIALKQEQVRQRIALNAQDASEVQTAARNLETTRQRLAEVRQRCESLSIRAPISGRIIAADLAHHQGAYLDEGTSLLTVGDPERMELIVSVDQTDLPAVADQRGSEVPFRIRGRRIRWGRMEHLEQHASFDIPHPALSAEAGGPLAVTDRASGEDAALRLAEPRFMGRVSLPTRISASLGAGESGYVRFGGRSQRIGQYLMTQCHQSVARLIQQIRG